MGAKKRKNIQRLIKRCRKKQPKTWHDVLMQEIRNLSELNGVCYILDMEQIYDAICNIPDYEKYSTRTIRAFDKCEVENDVYRNHDTKKIAEIFAAIDLSYKTSCELFI